MVLDFKFSKVQPVLRARHRNKHKLSEYNLPVFLFFCNACNPVLFTIKSGKFIPQPIGCSFSLFIKKVILETTSTTQELFGRERRAFSSISCSNTLFKNVSKSKKLLISWGWSKIRSTPLDACQYRKLLSLRLRKINPKLKFILNQRVCLYPKSCFLEKEGHR